MLMKFNPLVSIIIPVYNGENFIKDAIESALSQTYKNIEIIVVNDGSHDNTEKICKSFSNIRYFYKPNGGVASALNKGLKEANGTFFSWLSHDDLYKPEKIESQINFLKKIKSNNAILWSNYEVIDKNGKVFGRTSFEKVFSPYYLLDNLFPIFNGLIHGCSLLIPIALLNNFRGNNGEIFNESLRYTQDYDLWYRLFRNCDLYFISDCLIQSRQHDQQDSKKHNNFSECDSLWVRMFESLTPSEIAKLSQDRHSLLKSLVDLTERAGYRKAHCFFSQKLKEIEQTIVEDNTTRVSVITLVNDELNQTSSSIRSVLNQTEKNWELLIINNRTSNNLSNIKNKFSSYNRVKFIDLGNINSNSEALNIGINSSRGKYIAFLEPGDLWFPKKLQVQLDFMDKNNWKACHTSYSVKSSDSLAEISSGKDSYDIRRIIAGMNISISSVVLNRSFVVENQLAFPLDPAQEKAFLWIEIAEKTLIGGINEALLIVDANNNRFSNETLPFVVGRIKSISYFGGKKYSYLLQKELFSSILELAKLTNPGISFENFSSHDQVAIRRYRKLKYYFDLIFPPQSLRKMIVVKILKKIKSF